ncbi:protein slit-like [Chrysoperla carnea]|uniref:protein slit-like n=1 Tax=Chrysoperla carnea TaxID=189513 RepID=UPI001D07169A|nr:protein slit-like [Chrysoperla carnea]
MREPGGNDDAGETITTATKIILDRDRESLSSLSSPLMGLIDDNDNETKNVVVDKNSSRSRLVFNLNGGNVILRWSVLIITLTYFISMVHGQQAQYSCPARSEISPCLCTVKKNGLDILCEFTDSQHISKAMAALKGKTMVIYYLKLRHNQLKKLQGFIFLGLDIRHLTIHNSTLAAVEESSLSSIGKGLTQLDVSQNSLSSVPSVAFKNLHHLLILNMNHNRVSAIHSRAFEGLDTLEILTLYENKLVNIDSDAFRGLEKKLKRLNLGGNDLTSVPQKALSVLENLKKLEMQENQISKIEEGDFEGLRNLDSLGLAHNHLREIPPRVFSHLTLLNSLEMEGNSISVVDEEAFAGLEANLQYLRLGDNNLHQIPTTALRRLHRLRHLDLRSNNITVIAEDAFSGYGDSITFLNLQKNDIKQLPPLGFENLNSLETLNLQNNKIQHIPEEIMEPIVDTLRVVDIMDNPLICDCELVWYADWLKSLRGKDDEMMQKKRIVCTMGEHREYDLQNLPLDVMGCVNKNMGRTSLNGGNQNNIHLYYFSLLVTFGTVALGNNFNYYYVF